jgi:hypothetical protein
MTAAVFIVGQTGIGMLTLPKNNNFRDKFTNV